MFNPFMSPEEAQLQAQRQQMQIDSNLHEVFGWLEALDLESLKVVQRIMQVFANAPTDKAGDYANYYYGVVETLASQKYGICLACGKDHAADLSDILTPEAGE